MSLYSELFGEPNVASYLSDEATLQFLLDVEAALAEAEASVGVVPATCVGPIREAARAGRFDLAVLKSEAIQAGNVIIPLVRLLTEQVAVLDPDAARYVHVAATSQDIIDTGLVLQLRAALPALLAQVRRAMAAAARHASQHKRTPIAGRTLLQQATPTTFGLKVAGWLDALLREESLIETAATGTFVLQFGGASGTLAALGAAAPAVSRALGERLALPVPNLPWHSHRDRLVQFACALGVLTGTLGKIAKDLALLSQTEVGEAYEAPSAGRGGSSTMPHKRNPVAATVALAAAVRAPGLVSSLLAAMPQEHERGLGGWHAEWDVIPELLLLTAGAARSIGDALDHLVVDSARMAANLEITHGLIQAEAVVVELSRHMGRSEAYATVEAACQQALSEGRTFGEVLADDTGVTRVLTSETIACCLSPAAYIGEAETFVERVLAAWRRSGATNA